MSRNMIESNTQIFSLLDSYCANRSQPVRNAGARRWIRTLNSRDRDILKNADLEAQLSFSASRRLARFDYRNNTYICLIGFEYALSVLDLKEDDLQPGLLTAILAELRPQPIVSASGVVDIVDASDRDSDPEYGGHTAQAIASLFPRIRVFIGKNLSIENTWRAFFLMSIEECRAGESWIDQEFSSALETLGNIDLINIPYKTLCRSIFDSDPATMFLALYRCIEALYAYSSAQVLIETLQLTVSWPDLAASLEDKIGWYPREESSLTALMKLADQSDLEGVFAALGENLPGADTDLPQSTAKRIYLLRNSLVHFRPSHQKIDHDQIDWNRLCGTSARIVSSIYQLIFENAAPSATLTNATKNNQNKSRSELRSTKAYDSNPQLSLGGIFGRLKRALRLRA
jgi:hypothetical protein